MTAPACPACRAMPAPCDGIAHHCPVCGPIPAHPSTKEPTHGNPTSTRQAAIRHSIEAHPSSLTRGPEWDALVAALTEADLGSRPVPQRVRAGARSVEGRARLIRLCEHPLGQLAAHLLAFAVLVAAVAWMTTP